MNKVCKFCGNSFSTSHARNNYCKPECGFNARMERSDAKYIGKRFGMLTVVRRYLDKRTKYVCLCDCGNETIVRPSALQRKDNGRTQSCGCHRKQVGKRMGAENGLGQQTFLEPGTRFGRLTVIRMDGVNKNGATMCLCKCDCGNEKRTQAHTLLTGRCKSCGCFHREVSAENLRRARFKHGLSNDRAYLSWLKRQRYKDEQQWTYQMEAALKNLQPACVVCGSVENLHVDHVFPFNRGGKMVPGNVVILCRTCNISKSDRLLTDLSKEVAERIGEAAYAFLQRWNEIRDTVVNGQSNAGDSILQWT